MKNLILKLKSIKGKTLLTTGLIVYFSGFVFLSFVGQNYTGFMSFFAPFCIVTGIILISLGLLK
jgi:hypothetical protein